MAPFEVGVGTQESFSRITLSCKHGISQSNWQQLAKRLQSQGVLGRYVRYFNERKKEWYEGLRLSVSNINAVASFKIFLTLITFAQEQKVALSFSPQFDTAVGTTKVREYLLGKVSLAEFNLFINEGLKKFKDQVDGILYYKPYPEFFLNI